MITQQVKKILNEIPSDVKLIAVIKTRNNKEVLESINAGIKIIADNYVQEAQLRNISKNIEHHLIGHLQKNKVKKAVKIFDLIQTLDSLKLAKTINKECEKINKIMPVMIEINIAKEIHKTGIFPKDLENFVNQLINFPNIKIVGLMSMGSFEINLKINQQQFKEMKNLFDKTKEKYKDKINLKYLSMGMSSNYKIAIQEGANMIRIGTTIFGKRK